MADLGLGHMHNRAPEGGAPPCASRGPPGPLPPGPVAVEPDLSPAAAAESGSVGSQMRNCRRRPSAHLAAVESGSGSAAAERECVGAQSNAACMKTHSGAFGVPFVLGGGGGVKQTTAFMKTAIRGWQEACPLIRIRLLAPERDRLQAAEMQAESDSAARQHIRTQLPPNRIRIAAGRWALGRRRQIQCVRENNSC